MLLAKCAAYLTAVPTSLSSALPFARLETSTFTAPPPWRPALPAAPRRKGGAEGPRGAEGRRGADGRGEGVLWGAARAQCREGRGAERTKERLLILGRL